MPILSFVLCCPKATVEWVGRDGGGQVVTLSPPLPVLAQLVGVSVVIWLPQKHRAPTYTYKHTWIMPLLCSTSLSWPLRKHFYVCVSQKWQHKKRPTDDNWQQSQQQQQLQRGRRQVRSTQRGHSCCGTLCHRVYALWKLKVASVWTPISQRL